MLLARLDEGVLHGEPLPGGCRILGAQVARPSARDELLAQVKERHAGQRIEALTEGDSALEAALARAGFEVISERLHVARDLDGDWPAPELATRAAHDAGELFARVIPERELARLRLAAAAVFAEIQLCAADDTSGWRVLLAGGEPAGLLLAQAGFPARGHGTLLYIGIVPEARGRGLGAALHAHGLSLLRAAGAARYLDSTEMDNAAMRRVFARNGCAPCGSSRRWLFTGGRG